MSTEKKNALILITKKIDLFDNKEGGESLSKLRQEPVKQRPTGVSILVVLQVLGGLAFFALGVITLALVGSLLPLPQDVSEAAIFGVVLVSIIGGIMSVFGILGFVVAYGYWNGRGWAWTLGIVITVIGFILSLLIIPKGVSYMIISLIINGLIIYYLTSSDVKRYFGKNQQPKD